MRGAENRLNGGRPFSAWLENVGSKLRVFEKEGLIPQEELKEEGNNTFVIVSTDRGLCGGINSGIAKATRRQVGPIANESQLFIIGDKGRAQLRRDFGPSIRGNVTETYVNPPNFAVASAVAEAILASAPTEKKENLHILFNKFVSAIAYQPSIRSLKLNFTSEALSGYELETDSEDDLIAYLKEFELASAIYHGIIENSTSEESSRMSAMENATSNAQELISSLTLQYNKARQARITTELIEIISGAASLEG
jgi:F-type H+-transporting ATPase subunit gamma